MTRAPVHRPERLHEAVFSIVSDYRAEYRGIVQYYQLAHNLHVLGRLRWVMAQSLAKTLAHKLRITVRRGVKRFQATIATPAGPRKVLLVKVEREGRSPLVAQWDGIPLVRDKDAVLSDQPRRVMNNLRAELLERLANSCELCGSEDDVQVHHVRHLKDLTRKGRTARPEWAIRMAARRRKTLVVCRACHVAIHNGELRRQIPSVVHNSVTRLSGRKPDNVANVRLPAERVPFALDAQSDLAC
jgi:hypothetical protein